MADDPSQFKLLTQEELAAAFRTAAQGTDQDANEFFGRFKYVFDLFNQNASSAVDLGIGLLEKCRAADDSAYSRIHKGTPFYWIGSAAFLMRDYEMATFFFDAAVSEDLRAGAHPDGNSSPSLRFMLVEAAPRDQVARPLVQATEARLLELIHDYNGRAGRPPEAQDLTLAGVRDRLLRPSLLPRGETRRSLVSTLLSFSLEWNPRNQLLEIRPGSGTAEPFFLHLFKGCVLFESLLRCNPLRTPPAGTMTLRSLLKEFRAELGLPDNFQIGDATLPMIVDSLDAADESIQTAILFAGRIRNTVGHNLGWNVALDTRQYHRLFRMVSSSCLHSIACMYAELRAPNNSLKRTRRVGR